MVSGYNLLELPTSCLAMYDDRFPEDGVKRDAHKHHRVSKLHATFDSAIDLAGRRNLVPPHAHQFVEVLIDQACVHWLIFMEQRLAFFRAPL